MTPFRAPPPNPQKPCARVRTPQRRRGTSPKRSLMYRPSHRGAPQEAASPTAFPLSAQPFGRVSTRHAAGMAPLVRGKGSAADTVRTCPLPDASPKRTVGSLPLGARPILPASMSRVLRSRRCDILRRTSAGALPADSDLGGDRLRPQPPPSPFPQSLAANRVRPSPG